MSEPALRGRLDGVPERGRLVVGFSGGADSTALAHWLARRAPRGRILLAHVNHLLRGEESWRDERAAVDFARREGLRIQVCRADVAELAKERGQGLEECGRQVRYDFFHRLAAGEEDRILTAHNADDNAETILLNLCRGAGTDGLRGIPYRRGKVLRPLLAVSREEIEAYCRAWNLPFVTDSSNLSDDYTRNRLRHAVMPVLRELNPRFVQAAGQAAELLARDGDCLWERASALLEESRSPWGMETAPLLAAHESVRSRTVKAYLEERGCGRLEKRHLDGALRLLEEGGRTQLPGGMELHCAQGQLWAGRRPAAEDYEMPARLGKNPLPDGRALLITEKKRAEIEKEEKIQNLLFKNALDCDIMNRSLKIRNRRPGDRFAPAGRSLTKPLKQVFQELRVPAPLRGTLPLLVSGGEIAWCPGAGAGEGFKVTKGTRSVWIVEILEG